MRLTIERIRTMVVVAAALLLVSLAVFVVAAKWKSRFRRIDLPQRLAREIQQESQNFDYTHNFGAHSKFRIHAAKAIQLKNDRIDLHGVEIDLYGPNGTQADTIKGDEFEYDQKNGVATAAGPVEMLLTRPTARAGNAKTAGHPHKEQAMADATGQIVVQSSGISFDRNSGIVTTAERVAFSLTQGSGSAVGATFDSENGYLTLMRAVELTTYRGEDEVRIHAEHAEFDRGAQLCVLRSAVIDYRNGRADAGQARIAFRDNGSAERLDATDGFALTTATGGRLTAPMAAIDFDAHNQPRHGHLEGGVTIDAKRAGTSAQEIRTIHGASPAAELDFNTQGQLRHAHLERGVKFETNETATQATGPLKLTRTWRSPLADLDFRSVESAGKDMVELQTIDGKGGVTLTSESRLDDAAAVPTTIQADELTATFGGGSALRTIVGAGHAAMEQTTATGTVQTAAGDRLTATFVPPAQNGDTGSGIEEPKSSNQRNRGRERRTSTPDVQSAEFDGHVVLIEQPAAKPGAQPQPPLRATAGKMVYQGGGEWLHLTVSPRIVNGVLELTAEKMDLSRQSGNAFARGNVKATWAGGAPEAGASRRGPGEGTSAFGGREPAHVIAAEAELNESTGEARFRGHARLWQQANSVAAPQIVLNQHTETLTACTDDAAEPVRAVFLSAGATGAQNTQRQISGSGAGKTSMPGVIRVSGGDLEYFDAEHRAVMHAGVAGAVVAETGTATCTSDTVDLRIVPAASASGGQAQVDRLMATGHVALASQGRRGTGEQLVYSGVTGDYVLTGTAAAQPRITDSNQGSVTGHALIFHSCDDSVSIEGGGRETRTETTLPEARAR